MALIVNDTTPSVQYTATASQTTFAYPFEIFEDADLKVYQVSSSGTPDDTTDLLTLTTHYTVTNAGVTGGGDVVLVTGATVGDVITIKRDLAVKRTTDYQNLGDLASTSFNVDLDKLIMMVQQNEEAFGRSISLQESTQTPTTFDIDDPVAEYYATAKADLSGIKWVQALTTGVLSVSSYIETLLDDANAAAARTTLIAAGTTSNDTISGNNTYSGDNTHSGTNNFSGINNFSGANDHTGVDTFDSIVTSEGANIASATDCDIWAGADGNTVHLTGTTTVTDWGTAPQAGAVMRVICDAATPLTHNATTNDMNANGSNYTTSAGDVLIVYARSTSSYKVTILPYSGQSVSAGAVIQEVYTGDSAVATGTTITPFDDTIPQITEGNEFITVSITPTSTASILLIEAGMQMASAVSAGKLTAALHQDAVSDALIASVVTQSGIGDPFRINIGHRMVAGTTSAITFRVRVGAHAAGTITFNGAAGARLLGGVINSFIKVMEVQP